MPQRLSVAIKFPFCPSNIQLEELDIPEFYNGLNSILKKMQFKLGVARGTILRTLFPEFPKWLP